MSTPTFVVKKIGDRYIPVAQDSCAGVRAAWIAGGACLGFLGWRRGGLTGGLFALAGGGLIVRGALGYNPLSLCCSTGEARAESHRKTPSFQNDETTPSTQLPEDLVDEQSMESFPASDPPARSSASPII